MNRAGFLKTFTGVGVGLYTFDGAILERLLAAPARSKPATLTTLDAILREYYLPPIREQLNRECLHRCGSRYTVGWLDYDGRILRWEQKADAFEAVLCARCERCIGKYHGRLKAPSQEYRDSWHYARIRINGNAVTHDGFLPALKNELDMAVQDLIRHLQRYGPNWNPRVRITHPNGKTVEGPMKSILKRGYRLPEPHTLEAEFGGTTAIVPLRFLDGYGQARIWL